MKMILLTLLALLFAGCAALPDRARLDAIPKPDALRLCLDGPLGIEFCPQIPLRWEPVQRELDDRELRKLREEELRQRMRERKPHSARALT